MRQNEAVLAIKMIGFWSEKASSRTRVPALTILKDLTFSVLSLEYGQMMTKFFFVRENKFGSYVTSISYSIPNVMSLLTLTSWGFFQFSPY